MSLVALIAEDHRMMVDSLVEMVQSVVPTAEISTCRSRKGLVERVQQGPSLDLLILDMHLEDGNSLDLLHHGGPDFGQAHIVLYSGFPNDPSLATLPQGKYPLISKGGDPRLLLVEVVRGLGMRQRKLIANQMLSARQHETMQLISQGMTNEQIADRMGITISTVKNQNKQIFDKLGVQNRTQAINRYRSAVHQRNNRFVED